MESATLGKTLASELSGDYFAVRSSAAGEDSAEHSFAGQLDSFLFVARSELALKVAAVRASGDSPRMREYRQQRGLTGEPPVPAVIIQEMIPAECAGVAFSADPVTGRRSVAVVSAAWGLGSALVSGEADADTWKVAADGAILSTALAHKPRAHRAAPSSQERVAWQSVDTQLQNVACLSDVAVMQVAALARRAQAHFGCPQDIEWAWLDQRLYLLQSRPITSLGTLPDPDDALCLWDNSNISESYSGITSPLTFSFASRIYESVYREFCHILSVPAATIAASDGVFAGMLGHIRGRVYYNLLNWYRVLAVLPGFQLNRGFMEQMMGVREPLPEELVQLVTPPVSGRVLEWLRVMRSLGSLLWQQWTLERNIRRFYTRLNAALAPLSRPLTAMSMEELIQHYRDLEAKLLRRWDAPLVNDFFAMIFFGLLRGLCKKWHGQETLANTLVRDTGGIISLEPVRRIEALAAVARTEECIRAKLSASSGDADFSEFPEFASLLQDYIETFGDRCLEELKLESPSLREQPQLLLASIAAVSSRPVRALPAAAEEVEAPALSGLKKWIFSWVLAKARGRVRDRENLRFERTRLFGRVRQIMVACGHRLHADGLLAAPRDVFFLQLSELTGLCEASSDGATLRTFVAARKTQAAEYLAGEAPPDRILTRGPLHRYKRFAEETAPAAEEHGDAKQGLGCCAGIVRGPVQVVLDPLNAVMQDGHILVARHTDPGWVMLFPMASALLVERGSLLSHSAIVAREMGLPAVVGIPGLCSWLHTGDVVELDGARGVVRIVQRADSAT